MTQNFTVDEFIQSARDACGAIEQLELKKTPHLLSALIRLLCAADGLAQSEIRFLDEDVETQVELPEAVKRIPEDLVFQVVFDPLDPKSLCASSLKDALGDIYESLKSGLEALDGGRANRDVVLWEWKLDYETHWGRHLLDVIRFLFLCPREPGGQVALN